MKRTITTLYIIVFLFSIATASAENIYKTITVAKCDSLIQANVTNPNFVILDVRTYGEWVNDHLEGSINRSTGDPDFEEQLDKLPKQKTFLIHCQSGGRSAGAFLKMKNLEFAEVYEMQGGIGTWKNNGYPTTSKLAPKLMLVSFAKTSKNISGTDTINITITNRANQILTFSSASFNDIHEITNDFDKSIELAGAEDYTFSVYHTPGYFAEDTTKVTLESNGGELKIDIAFENGMIQNIGSEFQNELVIYPNPAKNYLYIKNSASLNIQDISIVSLNGQVVLQKSYFSISDGINVSHLKTGVYFVRLKTKKQVLSKKLLVR